MAVGPRPPSVDQLIAIAADNGLNMPVDDARAYQNLLSGAFRSYRRIDDLVGDRPPVKYARVPGYRPPPEENPFNAWYWKTDIKGAGSGPLYGERVGIKDSVSVGGVPMMCGSRILEGFVPDIDATVVTWLLDAGAVIAGKTNASDLCFSSGGHTTSLGPVRNPRKPTHSPGGSSKGSAAAIAAGDVRMAIGVDQGGSARLPGTWCGVVGYKPTYGLVPFTGGMSIEMTFDHMCPMADTVENAARMLSVIAGHDPMDPRQKGVIGPGFSADYTDAIGKGVKGVKIGVLPEGFAAAPWVESGLAEGDPAIDAKVRAVLKRLEDAGAEVFEVSVPLHIDGVHIWTGILLEGATDTMFRGNGLGSNWSGFYDTHLLAAFARGRKAQPNDLPHGIKMVLLGGEYMNRHYGGLYYAKAQNLAGPLRRAYDAALQKCDVLVMPAALALPRPIPDYDVSIEDYMFFALGMINNTPQFNVTGHPAISVPCAAIDDLPIGLQIVGRHLADGLVLQVADGVERLGDWREL
jgi:amidase